MKINKKFNKIWKEYAEFTTKSECKININTWKLEYEDTDAGTIKPFFEFLEKKKYLK